MTGGTVAVFGAHGAVGGAVVTALRAQGVSVRAVSRLGGGFDGVAATVADLHDAASIERALESCTAAVFPPNLTLSALALPLLKPAGVGRAVFFSSHNVTVADARVAYAPLVAAEEAVQASGLAWTLLRPTLIYGDPRLATVARVMALARRLPLLPMPGGGHSLQQPIYVEDLARVAAWAVHSAAAVAQIIPVGGPEVMTQRALYAAIARAAGQSGAVLAVPRWALRFGHRVLGARFPLGLDQIARADANRHIAAPFPLPAEVQPSTPLQVGLEALADRLA